MWALLGLIPKLFDLGGKWLDHKSKMSEARQDAELTVWATKENAGILWAQTMAEASKTSWKDEWILMLWSMPMMLAWFGINGPMQVTVDIVGVEMYRQVWLVMVGASFGVRIWESYTATSAANGGLASVLAKLPARHAAPPAAPVDPMSHVRPPVPGTGLDA